MERNPIFMNYDLSMAEPDADHRHVMCPCYDQCLDEAGTERSGLRLHRLRLQAQQNHHAPDLRGYGGLKHITGSGFNQTLIRSSFLSNISPSIHCP